MSGPVSRVLSRAIIYLARMSPCALSRATRMHGRAAVSHSYLRLLQMGFTKPLHCCNAGALLPHRFSFSRRTSLRESSFLWHFPSGHPAQSLTGILPYGARTFLTPRRAIAEPTQGAYCIKISKTQAHMPQKTRNHGENTRGKTAKETFRIPLQQQKITAKEASSTIPEQRYR